MAGSGTTAFELETLESCRSLGTLLARADEVIE